MDPQTPDLMPRRSGKLIPFSIAAAIVIGAAAYVLDTPTAPVAATSDNIDEQTRSAREAAFAALKPLHLQEVAPAEVPAAIASMGLSAPDQALLAKEGTKLVYITLYDSDAEDGDAVTVTSDGFSRTIVLKKAPTVVIIPRPRAGFFTLTGAVDGEGGGVTVGLNLPSGPFPLPIMSVGQTLTIPVGE